MRHRIARWLHDDPAKSVLLAATFGIAVDLSLVVAYEARCTASPQALVCKAVEKAPPWNLLSSIAVAPPLLVTWIMIERGRKKQATREEMNGEAKTREDYRKALREASTHLGGSAPEREAGFASLRDMLGQWPQQEEQEGVKGVLVEHLRGMLATGTTSSKSHVERILRFLTDPGWWSASVSPLDLSGTTFRDLDLHQIDLRLADLRRATFFDVNLEDANLRDAKLQGAKFVQCNLAQVDLSNAVLTKARFDHTSPELHNRLDGANLRNAKLVEAALRGASLCDADLRGADLTKADLSDAQLVCAKLDRAIIDDVNLQGAALHGADFRETIDWGTAKFTAATYGNHSYFPSGLSLLGEGMFLRHEPVRSRSGGSAN